MITVHTKKQCLYALMHCSCPMNTALGAGPKKKKKKWLKRKMSKCGRDPNTHLD